MTSGNGRYGPQGVIPAKLLEGSLPPGVAYWLARWVSLLTPRLPDITPVGSDLSASLSCGLAFLLAFRNNWVPKE